MAWRDCDQIEKSLRNTDVSRWTMPQVYAAEGYVLFTFPQKDPFGNPYQALVSGEPLKLSRVFSMGSDGRSTTHGQDLDDISTEKVPPVLLEIRDQRKRQWCLALGSWLSLSLLGWALVRKLAWSRVS